MNQVLSRSWYVVQFAMGVSAFIYYHFSVVS